nr:immunoglobulin heavy chain junction region [Macaca mulatta]MOY27570.1 immunoglobulin heavy chain junction region [Macaca mulatta]
CANGGIAAAGFEYW